MIDNSVINDIAFDAPTPDEYDPNIALIGCGDITESHLDAYSEAGFSVVAFCDIAAERAREKRDEYYPDGDVYTDAGEVFARDDVDVVDVALHPEHRLPVLEDAIRAGKHVLSQKPFVLDIDEGARIVDLADEHGVTVAVNQNARWAPQFSFIRAAVTDGLLGDVTGVNFDIQWDYNWIAGTGFEERHHAILFDYAIHWFDMVTTLLDDPVRVAATTARSPSQEPEPALLARTIIDYDGAQVSLSFDGDTRYNQRHHNAVVGTDGSIVTSGDPYTVHDVEVEADRWSGQYELDGAWFPEGFKGSMGELLAAIEEDRQPANAARENLKSLELTFAAAASADNGRFVAPGDVRSLPDPDADQVTDR